MKKAIVTGGLGFIGSHLVDRLIENGFEVTVIDNMANSTSEFMNSKAKYIYEDIRSYRINNLISECDIIYHLAAQIDLNKSIEDPHNDADNNIMGTINILELAKRTKCKKIVFTSTCAVYGDTKGVPTKEFAHPQNVKPYGLSKRTCERYIEYYCNENGIKYVCLRFGNVYGPRQGKRKDVGVISTFIKNKINKKTCIIYGDGYQTRSFIYIEDVVDALENAMHYGENIAVNIAPNEETKVIEIAKVIECDYKFEYDKSCGTRRSWLDNSRAKKELKWKPRINIVQGLIKTINWFEKEADKDERGS